MTLAYARPRQRDALDAPATKGDMRLLESSILAAMTYGIPSPPPPHDLEAERRVLVAYMSRFGAADQELADFDPSDLWSDAHRMIWSLTTAGAADEIRRSYRADLRLISETPSTYNPRPYVERVQQLARQRRALAHIEQACRLIRVDEEASAIARLRSAIAALGGCR